MQWTNSKSADVPSFRQTETNDVTIISCEASPRPESSTPSEVIQTFKASYKRPFKGSDVNYDIDLEPATEYNITSAFGCYRNTGTTTDGVFTVDDDGMGFNPDALSDDSSGILTASGCFGHWQTMKGTIVYTTYTTDAETGITVESSVSGENAINPINRFVANLEGLVEVQSTLLLLDMAGYLKYGVFALFSAVAMLI